MVVMGRVAKLRHLTREARAMASCIMLASSRREIPCFRSKAGEERNQASVITLPTTRCPGMALSNVIMESKVDGLLHLWMICKTSKKRS